MNKKLSKIVIKKKVTSTCLERKKEKRNFIHSATRYRPKTGIEKFVLRVTYFNVNVKSKYFP